MSERVSVYNATQLTDTEKRYYTHGVRDVTRQIKELIIQSMSFGIRLFPNGHFWVHITI